MRVEDLDFRRQAHRHEIFLRRTTPQNRFDCSVSPHVLGQVGHPFPHQSGLQAQIYEAIPRGGPEGR